MTIPPQVSCKIYTFLQNTYIVTDKILSTRDDDDDDMSKSYGSFII